MTRAEKALLCIWDEKKKYNPIENAKLHGPNNEPRIRFYLSRAGVNEPAPWCAALQYSVSIDAGFKPSELPARPSFNPASVYGWWQWAKFKGLLSLNVSDVRRGDLFFWCVFNPKTNSWQGHIGRIAEVKQIKLPGKYTLDDGTKRFFAFPGTYIRTWEGNGAKDEKSREGVEIVTRWRYVTSKYSFILQTRLG